MDAEAWQMEKVAEVHGCWLSRRDNVMPSASSNPVKRLLFGLGRYSRKAMCELLRRLRYLLHLCEKKAQERENVVMSEVYPRGMEGEEE